MDLHLTDDDLYLLRYVLLNYVRRVECWLDEDEFHPAFVAQMTARRDRATSLIERLEPERTNRDMDVS